MSIKLLDAFGPMLSTLHMMTPQFSPELGGH
jgi:hypothetical protein